MRSLLLLAFVAACSSNGGRATGDTGSGGMDLATTSDMAETPLNTDDGGLPPASVCVTDPQACYTVFAHSDHELYKIDLMAKTLVDIGPFNAPKVPSGSKMVEDSITDLAVAPDDVIWAISNTQLYTADPNDGHVTLVGKVTSCGKAAVAMTFGPDGTLYAGDLTGAFCKIDLSSSPPTVTQIGTLSGGLTLAGDIVAVGDGTMYGTAYRLSDTSGGTRSNNLLIKIDPTNAQTTVVGSTGFAKLFGVSYALGQVFGFSLTGEVVTINPMTGKGTLYKKFTDSSGTAIAFAGAGVNSMVAPTPIK